MPKNKSQPPGETATEPANTPNFPAFDAMGLDTSSLDGIYDPVERQRQLAILAQRQLQVDAQAEKDRLIAESRKNRHEEAKKLRECIYLGEPVVKGNTVSFETFAEPGRLSEALDPFLGDGYKIVDKFYKPDTNRILYILSKQKDD